MGNLEFSCERNDVLSESSRELHNLQAEIESSYTLSKEDFDRDFKWDNFSQWIWNCWMVSVLDSFVNFWDYEKLIRTHAKKNNKWWYDITLPMWDFKRNGGLFNFWKRKEIYHITSEDLLPQVSIEGEKIQLLGNGVKKWIHCLIIALWQKLAGSKNSSFDYNVLNGWHSVDVMDALMINFYSLAINRKTIGDEEFNKKLKSYLKIFDSRTDMMTVSVKWQGSWKNMWKVSEWKGWTNHAISVDSVFYKQVENYFWWKSKEMRVRLSNPHDSSDTYEMPYYDFKNKCWKLHFWSKKMGKVEKDYGEPWTFNGKNERINSTYSGDFKDSLNWYIQNEWGVENERNLVVKEWCELPDWRIVSREEWNGLWRICYIVESYGKKVIVKRNWNSYTFSCDGNNITFNGELFSDKGTSLKNWINDLINKILPTWIRNQSPEKIKFFISAMEFANSINYFRQMHCKWLVIKEWQIFRKWVIALPIYPEWLGFKDNISVDDKTKIVNYINKII